MQLFGHTVYFPHRCLRLNLGKEYVKDLSLFDRIKYMLKHKVLCFPIWNNQDVWVDKVLRGWIK